MVIPRALRWMLAAALASGAELGLSAWATLPGDGCRASRDGDMVLHLTKFKPT